MDRLLALVPEELLGAIILLNREARYRNGLNVVELVAQVSELRARTEAALPASSPS